MDDEMDWSFLEREWEVGRAVQITEELATDYNRFMEHLGPRKVQAALDQMPAGAVAWLHQRPQTVWRFPRLA